MTDRRMPERVLLVGADRPCGSEVTAALQAHGWTPVSTLPDEGEIAGAVLISTTKLPGLAFDAIGDADFLAATATLTELVTTCQAAIPRLAPGGAVVILGSRGGLGGWGGAHTMAAASACTAMVRSIAMEFAPIGLRANLVAAEFADRLKTDPASRLEAAALVALLLSEQAAGVTGEMVLANRGASLSLREARRR